MPKTEEQNKEDEVFMQYVIRGDIYFVLLKHAK